MDSILVDQPSFVAAPSPYFSAASLHSLLKDSTNRFLAVVAGGGGAAAGDGLSAIRDIFSRLLLSSLDPPLEAVWFHAALGFHQASAAAGGSLAPVRDLLQLLVASAAANPSGAKSVALLAPAVAELYHAAAGSKARKEILGLAEGVLAYITICSGNIASRGGDAVGMLLMPGFGDLVKVWAVRRSGEGGSLEAMFPLVGKEVRDRLQCDGCGVGYLAGVVVAEAFLLGLCLKLQGAAAGQARQELQKELRIWAVSSITAFRNREFFDILAQMLLQPPLPLMGLMVASDELLVRDILYDALVLLDYSFLSHPPQVTKDDDPFITTILTRLVLAHEAIIDTRNRGDHVRAMSYLNAFVTSTVPGYLIKWVSTRFAHKNHDKLSAATPQALLKWLTELERDGPQGLGDIIPKLTRKRLTLDETRGVGVTMESTGERFTDGEAELYFVDKQGGVSLSEDAKMTDSAFISAAQEIRLGADGRRKRKGDATNGGVHSKAKFVKYRIEDSSLGGEYFDRVAAGGGDSEVENDPSDDEMEEELVNF